MVDIVHPERLECALREQSGGKLVLSDRHVEQWRQQGYLLVDNLFAESRVQQALEELTQLQMKKGGDDFQVGDGLCFPTGLPSLDSLTLDPALLVAVKQLLGVEEIRLSQGETWKKTAYADTSADAGAVDRTYSNQDQRIHMDYLNHTLLHPPPWDRPEAVAAIVYLSHSEVCSGGTRVVPRSSAADALYQWPYCNMPGFGSIPWLNDRTTVEDFLAKEYPDVAAFRQAVYARERGVSFTPGTVLLYRHDIWHRGTPLKPNAQRFVQNLVFKKPRCDWLNNWNVGTAFSMYRPDQYVEKLIARMDIHQRNCLGIPYPGHPYWTAEMLAAVEIRYKDFGIDMTPYKEVGVENAPCEAWPKVG
mmetsp:Transcript_7570/g.16536  ORF Transcript_7570/g.16536 Transcript_7570/m.16536 type:complete len:361 (+) Transcript_7570:16-1098(+)